MQLLECSAMNGLQKLQQKLKNGDFFMIQKAVSQALTAFFILKKLLKTSLLVISLSLLRFFYRPPISFLAPDFFPRPPKNLSLNDNDNVNDNVNVNDNDNDLFLFDKKKQKARA